MTTLLTTKDLQDLINVDKSTIYRMAEDGRLPAVKVGRQWRFPAEQIADMLGGTVGAPESLPAPGTAGELATLLVPETAEAVTELVADLFGVMAVITDMQGRPLTDVANPNGYFQAIADQPGAVEKCARGWRELGEDGGIEPRFKPSHLGFLCTRTFIRVGNELVGMLIVGGITPADWPPSEEFLAAAAAELDLPVSTLLDHVDETYYVDEGRQKWILGLLPRISDLISRLAAARNQLLDKLDAIAALAGSNSTQRSEL
jgi:excisionase family DNA binding protein